MHGKHSLKPSETRLATENSQAPARSAGALNENCCGHSFLALAPTLSHHRHVVGSGRARHLSRMHDCTGSYKMLTFRAKTDSKVSKCIWHSRNLALDGSLAGILGTIAKFRRQASRGCESNHYKDNAKWVGKNCVLKHEHSQA